MFFYTQPATPELIKLQISSSSTSDVTNILSQILAIKLSDDFTENTDYFKNEVLGDYTITTTPTAQAITGSFTPNGTDRWLFIGHMIHDVVTIVDEIGFELYDSVAGVLNSCQMEGEDATNDFRGHNLYWAGVPSNAARTLTVRPFGEAGSNVALATRVFAINLSKFAQSVSIFDAAEVDPAGTPTYSTVATVAPTPTNTGNWVVIASSVNDSSGTTDDFETRLQVDASGGGLASSPAYSTTAPGQDNWDPLDETPFTVFNLVSLSSGGARTINWDWRQVAGTGGRIEDNLLVAFSVALAASGVTVTPAAASAVAAKVDPAVVLGSLSLSPVAVSAIGAVVDPTTVLGSLNLIPAVASVVGAVVDPTVILGSLAIEPSAASAIGVVIDPTVVFGSLSVSPAAVTVVVVTIDPAVLGGGVEVTPAAASVVGAVVDPAVILGALALSPAAVSVVAERVAPTVILGSITVSPDVDLVVVGVVDPAVIFGSVMIAPEAVTVIVVTINPTVIGGDAPVEWRGRAFQHWNLRRLWRLKL
jgi:hypothetical protein